MLFKRDKDLWVDKKDIRLRSAQARGKTFLTNNDYTNKFLKKSTTYYFKNFLNNFEISEMRRVFVEKWESVDKVLYSFKGILNIF